MYIKDKIESKNKIEFKVSPIFTTHGLIKRAREIVDDYFTFNNFDNYSEKFNFRKYCISPIFDVDNNGYKYLSSVKIEELLYKDEPFEVIVAKNGSICFSIPESMHEDERSAYITRFERMIQYVM